MGNEALSVFEIWEAEYQGNNALLVRPADGTVLEAIAQRENCPSRVLSGATGDGRVVVYDSRDNPTPVDPPLELDWARRHGKFSKTIMYPTRQRGLLSLEAPLLKTLRLVCIGHFLSAPSGSWSTRSIAPPRDSAAMRWHRGEGNDEHYVDKDFVD